MSTIINTYPDPDDTDPCTRDRLYLGEAPISVSSDDGRHELGDTESAEKGE